VCSETYRVCSDVPCLSGEKFVIKSERAKKHATQEQIIDLNLAQSMRKLNQYFIMFYLMNCLMAKQCCGLSKLEIPLWL
jgi:hypothetical protein